MRVTHNCRRLLFLETAPDLHWNTGAVICRARWRWPVASALVIYDSEGRGSVGICVSTGLEAVSAPQSELIFTAELGHWLGEHGDLISIVLPYEVSMPLFPSLRLELLWCLFLNNLIDLNGLLSHKMVMKISIIERLLLIFLSLA